MKYLVDLRDCMLREPFSGSLTVAHINRSQKSYSKRGFATSNLEKKKKIIPTNFINIIIILVSGMNCLSIPYCHASSHFAV